MFIPALLVIKMETNNRGSIKFKLMTEHKVEYFYSILEYFAWKIK